MIETIVYLDALRVAIADWLNTVLVDNGVFFFNIWHIVHLLGGFLGGILLSMVGVKDLSGKVFVGFSMILVWELFEFTFYHSGSTLFLTEILVDVFWDTFLGMAGVIISHFLFNKKV